LLGRLGEQPHKLVVPGEQRERTIEDLIHTSLTLLDEQTQAVFLAMGAFFDRQMTPEMLGIYMGRVGDDLRIVPPNDEPSIVGARHASPLPPHPPNSPSQGAYADAPLPTHPMEPVAVEQALETLMLRGLAEKIPAKSEPASQTCVTHYRLHDLAYSYAKANNKDEHRQGALDACLIYVRRYAEPILPNFAALRPELYNLLGAANWALLIERYVEVEVLAIGLYVSYTGDGFLRLQGYSLQSLGLLEIAAQAAERQENRGNQAAHLSHLGLAYTDLGRYRQAIDYHQQAMTISRKIGDRETESTILSNLGIVYRQLGQYPQAIDYAQQALTISHEIGDRRGEGLALEGLGVVYKDLGQYEQAIAYHQQALTISRNIGERRKEAENLGNLGIAYRNLGQYKQAIDYAQQALTISRDIGDRPSEGNALGNLGIVYLNLGQYGQGIDYCQQALTIAQEIGDRHGESNRLGNLGTAYLSLGQYKQAIHYYEQSLAIRREIEEWRGEGEILHNLGTAYRFLGEPQKALEYYHQARAIFVELGVEHLVTQTDQNIAALQGNSSRSAPPPASPVKTDRSAIKSQAQELRQLYRDGGEAAVREHLQAQGKSPAAIEVILEGLRKEGT
jgi:tetratricopeptide (TPR) repeat protein